MSIINVKLCQFSVNNLPIITLFLQKFILSEAEFACKDEADGNTYYAMSV